ncbi:MAG: branched-chain amino acid ABC transporter substrate-binding protein [Actinobacteria bacterium]|nr:branched-chain amino acid ABC transporter substrate-binding protein [Actinomycetota bacterium]
MSRKIVALLIAMTLVLSLGLAGCSSSSSSGGNKDGEKKDSKEPIKIGIIGPISGQWALEGEGFKNASTLLADQINAAGGLLGGRKIDLVIGDDKGDPKEAALVAQKLVTSKVVAVVGSYASSLTEPASNIFNEAGLLQVTPSSTATKLTTKGFQKFFRTCFLDDRQGLFAAEFITGTLGKKNVAIIHDNTTYAKGLADWTKKYVEEKGGKVVFFDAITPGEKDFNTTITSMKAAKPEAIYFTGYFPEGGLLLKQTRDQKIDVPFIGGDANANPDFVKIAGGTAAKGFIATTLPLPSDLPYPEAKKFMDDYKAKYGEVKSIWTVTAADAFRVIVEAIKQTNSTDSTKLAEYLHKNLKNFPGFTGPITFDEKGDRTGAIHTAYVVDDKGNYVVYKK